MLGKRHLIIVRRRTGWTPDSEGRGGVTTADTTVRGHVIGRPSKETGPAQVGRFGQRTELACFVEASAVVSDQDLIVLQATVPDPTSGLPTPSRLDPFLFGEYEIAEIDYTTDHLDLSLRRSTKASSTGS